MITVGPLDVIIPTRYVPSSRRVAYTAAGLASAKRSE